jgi:two-component system, response regulator PdtaR
MAKVLIVEDDLLIADLLEDVLVRAGYEVCGMSSTVSEAVGLCNLHQPDLAVIDMGLADDGHGTDIAARIGNRDKLGILYATGNAGHPGLTASDGDAYIIKPYQAADIVRALQLVQEIFQTGKTSKPFPRNFELLRKSNMKREAPSHAHGH